MDVAALRKERGWSRERLAQETGTLGPGQIWRIEKKGVINDEERAILERVFSTAIEVVPRPQATPTPAPQPVAQSVPVAVVEAQDVDLAALYEATAKKTYSRYVSNSEIQTFKRCRRKWWLAWHRGLRPITESPVGVRQIGARLHRALQQHYVPAGPAGPDTLLDALEREIMIDRTLLADDVLPDIRLQFEKDADLERIMLEGYLQWLAETGADSELEVIAPEQYLEAEAPGMPDTAIIGKIDVRVRRKTDGARLFLDHKSMASFTQATVMLPLDEQMLHYHLLEQMQGGDERTAGALYNMLRRVKRTERAKPPFYDRVEVHHNAYELTNYATRLHGVIQDIKSVEALLANDASHQFAAYPRPTRDCVWDCPFFAFCPMFDDGSRVEAALEAHFVQGDPLDYYRSEVLGLNE